MILVVGEALVDLVIASDGTVDAVLGGAPYNTARAAARLGADVSFVGGLSVDRFGQLLRDRLVSDGVDVEHAVRLDVPTTLAAAELDDDGAATYRFYVDGTAAPAVGADDVRRATSALARHDLCFVGGLGLALAPICGSIDAAIGDLDPDVFLVVDVNCRSAVIADRDAYVSRLERLMSRADIVKASDDDLAYLHPTLDALAAAREILSSGTRCVVITAGASSTTVVTADALSTVPVPPAPGPVVDSIGAGDTFDGGLLAWFDSRPTRSGRDDVVIETVVAAVRIGHAAAGIVVTRRGADPPHRDDLSVDWT